MLATFEKRGAWVRRCDLEKYIALFELHVHFLRRQGVRTELLASFLWNMVVALPISAYGKINIIGAEL